MRSMLVFALLLLSIAANAQDGQRWTVLTPGQSYGLRPIEGEPFIVLAAVRGATLSEPINVGFYVLSSPVCKALENPVDGPATGFIGKVALVEIDGKDYALDGQCDGGNLTMAPSYWATRKSLIDSVRSDQVMSVRFKPGPYLHYRTEGFSGVLNELGVTLPSDQVASASAPIPASGRCSNPYAPYPSQAIRLKQQGVTQIGFDVDASGRPNNLTLESSSGSSLLDSAAMSAISRVICNVPTGTHKSLSMTFSLNKLN